MFSRSSVVCVCVYSKKNRRTGGIEWWSCGSYEWLVCDWIMKHTAKNGPNDGKQWINNHDYTFCNNCATPKLFTWIFWTHFKCSAEHFSAKHHRFTLDHYGSTQWVLVGVCVCAVGTLCAFAFVVYRTVDIVHERSKNKFN